MCAPHSPARKHDFLLASETPVSNYLHAAAKVRCRYLRPCVSRKERKHFWQTPCLPLKFHLLNCSRVRLNHTERLYYDRPYHNHQGPRILKDFFNLFTYFSQSCRLLVCPFCIMLVAERCPPLPPAPPTPSRPPPTHPFFKGTSLIFFI